MLRLHRFGTLILLCSLIAGCSNGSGIVENSNSSTPGPVPNRMIEALDALDTRGATGNLLSCMWSNYWNYLTREGLEGRLILPDESPEIWDGIKEGMKRAKMNASGELLKVIESVDENDRKRFWEICDSFGPWVKGEFAGRVP